MMESDDVNVKNNLGIVPGDIVELLNYTPDYNDPILRSPGVVGARFRVEFTTKEMVFVERDDKPHACAFYYSQVRKVK